MALEDPRDKSTRGQRTSEGRVGAASDKGGKGGVSDATRNKAYKQYADTMIEAGQANLQGPPGFDSATAEYNNRTIWDKILDFFNPFTDDVAPTPTDSTTYSGGTFHQSTNFASLAAKMAGFALGGVPGIAASAAGDLLSAFDIGSVHWGSADDGTKKNSPINPKNQNSNRSPSKTPVERKGGFAGLSYAGTVIGVNGELTPQKLNIYAPPVSVDNSGINGYSKTRYTLPVPVVPKLVTFY